MPQRNLPTLMVIFLLIIVFSACSGKPDQDPLITQGEKLFTANCISCHPTDPGETSVGPDLVGLGASLQNSGQDAASTLTESIREPGKVLSDGYQNLMPAADVLGLDDEDLQALIAYLVILEE